MKSSIFRDYDIRGRYPDDINEEISYTIGLSYGTYIQKNYKQTHCVVSCDNRLSSPSLKTELIRGITDSGCNVLDYGTTTTPMHFYARYINGMFGIVVTASHNPKDDNGFKFSFDKITNARGEMIKDFKTFTFNKDFFTNKPKGIVTTHSIDEKYLDYLRLDIKLNEKRKIKAVFDPGNGTMGIILRKALNFFPIDFEIINEESDGTFPNHHPDPAVKDNLKDLQKKVLETKADIGIAFDGDGDRVGFVKEDGSFLSTEEFMILIIRDISFKVTNRSFLYDVKCSKSLEDEILKLNAKPIMYRTGASFTQAKTHEDNIPFGGEFSGHVYFRDRVFDVGSALYAALRLIEILSNTDKTLSFLTSDITKYYATEEIKIPTSDDKKFLVVQKVLDYFKEKKYPLIDIDGVRVIFKEGWALVRASNTGPNLICRCEANSEENKKKLEDYILTLINTFSK